MADGFLHGNYLIYAAAIEDGPGKWIPSVSIVRHHDGKGEALEKTFPGIQWPQPFYPSQDAAIGEAIQVGRAIIDGCVEGATVEDL